MSSTLCAYWTDANEYLQDRSYLQQVDRVDLRHTRHHLLPRTLLYLFYNLTSCTSCTLVDCDALRSTPEVMETLVTRMLALRVLNVNQCADLSSTLVLSLPKCEQLQCLNLVGSPLPAETVMQLMAALPAHLEQLLVDTARQTSPVRPNLDAPAPLLVPAACTRLTHLRLAYHPQVRSETLRSLARHQLQLTALDMTGCYAVQDWDLVHVAHMLQLRDICLAQNVQLTDAGFAYLFDQPNHVWHKLQFDECIGLSNETIRRLLLRMQSDTPPCQLREISLHECPLPTLGQGWVDLVTIQRHSRLESLALQYPEPIHNSQGLLQWLNLFSARSLETLRCFRVSDLPLSTVPATWIRMRAHMPFLSELALHLHRTSSGTLESLFRTTLGQLDQLHTLRIACLDGLRGVSPPALQTYLSHAGARHLKHLELQGLEGDASLIAWMQVFERAAPSSLRHLALQWIPATGEVDATHIQQWLQSSSATRLWIRRLELLYLQDWSRSVDLYPQISSAS